MNQQMGTQMLEAAQLQLQAAQMQLQAAQLHLQAVQMQLHVQAEKKDLAPALAPAPVSRQRKCQKQWEGPLLAQYIRRGKEVPIMYCVYGHDQKCFYCGILMEECYRTRKPHHRPPRDNILYNILYDDKICTYDAECKCRCDLQLEDEKKPDYKPDHLGPVGTCRRSGKTHWWSVRDVCSECRCFSGRY
jgi:hypothetical protein